MDLKIEYIPLSDLTPYDKNARRHTARDVKNIAASIKRFGMCDAIGIWGDDNTIVEGHGRALACKELGIELVPCVRLDHLSDEERRSYAIAHNATAELSEWDFDFLKIELPDLDLKEFDFEFLTEVDGASHVKSFEEMQKDFEARMEAGELSDDDEEYQEFLAKFEAKKTTDDCYTPPVIYDAVADYVANKYSLNKDNFVRPFVPGGDYQAYTYKPTDVVVDNPPFSIMSEILTFYNDNGIRFFLFAPHLTLFSSASHRSTAIVCGVIITYENGANVSTSFLTNLEDCAFRSSPTLYAAIDKANKENLKAIRKELPRYSYPLHVLTSAMLAPYSRYGIPFEVKKDECAFIRALDSQKESGKSLFGSGFLISDNKKAEREKAEREKAEREKAEVWSLSERELEIIRSLK
jgi:hypothetical protein